MAHLAQMMKVLCMLLGAVSWGILPTVPAEVLS